MRNHTPPYITALPEVTHRRLGDHHDNDPSAGTRGPLPQYLILASDGFADVCSGEGQRRIITSWADAMTPSAGVEGSRGEKLDNRALRLLWRALGGEDRYRVSRVLTLDMDVAWIDDTAIVVQTL